MQSPVTGIDTGGQTPPSAPVVLDATALDTGHRRRGIGRYTRGLVRGMASQASDQRLDGRLVTLRLKSPFGERTEDISAAPDAPAGPIQQWHLRRPTPQHRVRWVFNELFLPGELRRRQVALYHSTEPWSAPPARGFASVLTCHDLIPLLFPEQYLNRRHLYWRAYYTWMNWSGRWDHLSRIIAISEATRRSLIERLGIDEKRIEVVYNGIDHDFFHPVEDDHLAEVRRRYELERPFVLYLGGYDYRKNIGALVEAMADVPESLDVELVLAGGMDEETADRLTALADSTGGSSRMRRLGYVDDADLPALYSLAQVFVYPSLAEGFGLQLLEAMACGCPVVAADRTSLPEVVENAGLLVDPERPAAIADAITRLLEDEQLRETMRRRGLERAAQFSWERCARETLAVYRDLL